MMKMGYQLEELLPVVAELASRYTGYEHSSVTYERAEMLMGAVLYCIHEYADQGEGVQPARSIPAGEAYRIGREIVIRKVRQLHALYNDMILDFQDYGVECLRDTIVKGIPQFLLRYDVDYAPQETLLTLDYPVQEDLSGLSGIDAVLAYVECVQREQQYLRQFDSSFILDRLRAYHPEYEMLVENISGMAFGGR